VANKIYTQVEHHKKYGGVVPEIASRAHLEKISSIVEAALTESELSPAEIDLIAFTRGPGLIGPLLVGASFAIGLAKRLGIAAYGMNHLEGHLAAAYLSDKTLVPPFICLTVSGGHTELYRVDENFKYTPLGKTRDDAAGEAFDKCGKLLGLGYPAGPLVSKNARNGQPAYYKFPRGLQQKDTLDFSFSGLKTSFATYLRELPPKELEKNFANICASLQEAIVDILVKKSMLALEKSNLDTLAVCGGVSANLRLRDSLIFEGKKRGIKIVLPGASLCTDNGAMIAGIAHIRKSMGNLPKIQKVTPFLPLEKSFSA